MFHRHVPADVNSVLLVWEPSHSSKIGEQFVHPGGGSTHFRSVGAVDHERTVMIHLWKFRRSAAEC